MSVFLKIAAALSLLMILCSPVFAGNEALSQPNGSITLKQLSTEYVQLRILKDLLNDRMPANPQQFDFETLKACEVREKIVQLTGVPDDIHELLALPPQMPLQISRIGGSTLILYQADRVYSFGDSLGISHNISQENQRKELPNAYPLPISFLKNQNIKKLSSGSYHTLFLTSDGAVYSFGSYVNGRLGRSIEFNTLDPAKIDLPEEVVVADISAGNYHSLVLTENGEIYSFGDGHNGLGLDTQYPVDKPTKIERLASEKITAIGAGYNSSLALSETGLLYSFGYCRTVGTGHGVGVHTSEPQVIEALRGEKITNVAAKGCTFFALTDHGEVYSFGAGALGTLGHGDKEDQLFPKKITSLTGVKITAISAGLHSTLLLSDQGEVYSFGKNKFGSLGRAVPAESPKEALIPRKIQALAGKKIVQILAGDNYNTVVDEAGQIYIIGQEDWTNWGILEIPGLPEYPIKKLPWGWWLLSG